jgi:uncharacterized membrane protein YcaP (DUF421 family)
VDFIAYLTVVGKTIGFYALALVLFRLMGKRTLGDMEPLDFVIVLVIAEIVGAPLADRELPVVPAIIAVTTLAMLQLLLSYATVHSSAMEKALEGKPAVVVKEGRVLEDSLRKAKVSSEELAGRLRERGFVDASDVEIATLEADGMLSAIPKREAAPVTPRFLGLDSSTMLLVKGKPDRQGLEKAGMTVTDLRRVLRGRRIEFKDADEVFVDPGGDLRVTLNLSRSIRKREAARRRKPKRPRRVEGKRRSDSGT